MAFDQAAFRFRNDDGSETTATWHSPLNTNIEFIPEVDSTIRLRLLIQCDSFELSNNFELQYSLNSGTWTDITDATAVVREKLSSNFGQLDPTTQQIGAGSFTGGQMLEQDFETFGNQPITMAGSDEIECEWCFEVEADDVVPGDLLDFRVTHNGGTGDITFSETPRISFGTYVPIETLIPVVPSRMPDPRSRRIVAGRGGHHTEVYEHFFSDPEMVTADRVLCDFPVVMRRKPWRPEGHFGYTEVPVPADVVEHGWEFFTQRDVRREVARRSRHLFGTTLSGPVTADFSVLTPLTILASLKTTPTFLVDDLDELGTFEAAFGTNLEGLE